MAQVPVRGDVTVDTALDALEGELPKAHGSLAIERIALRKAHTYLADQGPASTRKLQEFLVSEDLTRYYSNRTEFWNAAMQPYLPLLPGISHGPGRQEWRHDPDVQPDRSPVPEDPKLAAAADVHAAIDAVVNDVMDAPNQQATVRHRSAVLAMYEYLQDERAAPVQDLRDVADPWTTDPPVPAQGLYKTAGEWFSRIGRDALAAVPGIEAPDVAGLPWVLVGVEDSQS